MEREMANKMASELTNELTNELTDGTANGMAKEMKSELQGKYRRLFLSIKQDIEEGNYKVGSKLPSIRETSARFNCSTATAIRAYRELEKGHLIYAKPKSGYYVLERKAFGSWEESADPDVNNFFDFYAASPDRDALPYQDFQHCVNQAINVYKDSLFNYTDLRGLVGLRKALEKYFPSQQIFASFEQIFITSGSQQAIYLLAGMPFPNGKQNILVEQPTFVGMLKSAEINHATVIGIERNVHGIDLAELERIFRNDNVKFFYTIPRFHNPTGFSYSNQTKRAILDLANKYDVYIVEDDYLAELETNTKCDPMYAFDSESRVVYLKSFSKTLLPGLRIGAAIIPRFLINTFSEYKRCADLNTSVLSQGALEVYLKSGMFESHVGKIKTLYQERMRELKQACGKAMPSEIKWFIPETGFFAYCELPGRLKAETLVNALQAKNVRLLNADLMFLPSFRKNNGLRLSVCRINRERIKAGVLLINGEAKRLLSAAGAGPIRTEMTLL